MGRTRRMVRTRRTSSARTRKRATRTAKSRAERREIRDRRAAYFLAGCIVSVHHSPFMDVEYASLVTDETFDPHWCPKWSTEQKGTPEQREQRGCIDTLVGRLAMKRARGTGGRAPTVGDLREIAEVVLRQSRSADDALQLGAELEHRAAEFTRSYWDDIESVARRLLGEWVVWSTDLARLVGDGCEDPSPPAGAARPSANLRRAIREAARAKLVDVTDDPETPDAFVFFVNRPSAAELAEAQADAAGSTKH